MQKSLLLVVFYQVVFVLAYGSSAEAVAVLPTYPPEDETLMLKKSVLTVCVVHVPGVENAPPDV